MTSTYDLVSRIPAYMVEILSTRILGKPADACRLAEELSDETRLKRVLGQLTDRQLTLLIDLYELGGSVPWDVLTAVHLSGHDELREDLSALGLRGVVFQGGLSGRDPVILLPSLYPLLDEVRRRHFADPGDITWTEPERVSIRGHIALLNALRMSRIRCRAGMEPFKRGWQFLEERLGELPECERVYWELVELGCIEEKNGVLSISSEAARELAAEGDARYPVWRFIRSCKDYPGLDHKAFTLMGDRALQWDYLARSLKNFILSRNPDETGVEGMVRGLIGQWLDLGVMQADRANRWLKFAEPVYQALKTGRIEISLKAYGEEVVVQPDMEVLVPGNFDPVDLLNLGEIADLMRSDVVSIYRITKRSISRALHLGWDLDKIGAFLERTSRHELPDNVNKTIRGWVMAHSEARILRGTFLVLNDAGGALPPGLDEVLPGVYRVPENREEEVLASLANNDVIVRGATPSWEGGQGARWGMMVPTKLTQKKEWKEARKEGIFPFGMVTPLPYGAKGEGIFEKALLDGRSVVIFYPRHGYGEIQVKKISPVYLFRKGGIPFVEAFCEDTGEGEMFDITKIRAMLLNC
ncbi:MAG: helicase-associated domain-containing protein [Desulfomonilia bacterium]|uniref:Helicase XPB/Ssl2 N-terminal domain-containing protein n=1 Tax=anaerobic digester metagenome TaxID=1263854 RepID=A0A485M6I8_9ZZZZ|nr:helicase-associated domain-containing protein [Pseudomonadota bacterium]HON38103.1 helicase-associated domain-containing protein [Deltaproteobacteria bacterium]HRS56251.1 helicase-associated domain-containing protein [Desulfomonilia bacterium]HPD21712.1 helicase-associated domain-containing protein [Deltaproteobacteria bacterium]HPX18974.1 helicase-associated domain-containing protein [Deltaproteobacteria bacterium]